MTPHANAGAKLLFLLAILLLPLGGLVFLQGGDPHAERVVVYTAHNQQIVDQLVPRFQALTGIEVEVVKLGSGDLIQRRPTSRPRPTASTRPSASARTGCPTRGSWSPS